MRSSLIGILFLASVSQSHGQFLGIGNATEFTQILNNVELVAQEALQAKMHIDMVMNSVKLGRTQSTDIARDIQVLANAAQYGIAIASSAAGEENKFRRLYPGYTSIGGTYQGRYAQWVQTVLDTMSGSIRSSAKQHASIQDSLQVLQMLKQQASGVNGRLEAIQAVQAMTAEVPAQLMALRQQLLTQHDAYLTVEGQKLQNEATGIAAEQDFFRYTRQRDEGNRVWSVR